MDERLLLHAVLNQLETDFDDQDYDAIDEMLQLLLKNDESKKILIEYLSDSALENVKDGTTNCRYTEQD